MAIKPQRTIQGELERGRRLLQEAMAIHRQEGNLWAVSETLEGLAVVEERSGNLAAAEALLRQRLKLDRQLGAAHAVIHDQVSVAMLVKMSGRCPQAIELAQEAEALAVQAGLQDQAASAASLAAACLQHLERQDEARQEIDRAAAWLAGSQDTTLRFYVLLTRASLLNRQGSPAEAKTLLEGLLREARQKGYIAEEINSQVMLAESVILLGDEKNGFRMLREASSEARARGHGSLADHARLTLEWYQENSEEKSGG